MDDPEYEPDPAKRKPTILWMALALIVAALFAAVVSLHGHPGARSAYGPPAGAPAGDSAAH
jgi:hypothetical protein